MRRLRTSPHAVARQGYWVVSPEIVATLRSARCGCGMLSLAPCAALGGGDEDHAPPSAGPPGPWDGAFQQEGPIQAFRNASLRNWRGAGRRAGLGAGAVCGAGPLSRRDSTGARLPELGTPMRAVGPVAATTAFTAAACNRSSSGAAGRPTASSERTVQGLSLHRAAPVPDPGPLRRERQLRRGRAADRPQLHALQRRAVAVGTEPELRAAWANPRMQLDHR